MVEVGIHSIIRPKVNTTQRLAISSPTDRKMVMAITTIVIIQFRLLAGNHPRPGLVVLPVDPLHPLRVPITTTTPLTLPLSADKEISNTVVAIPAMALRLIDDVAAGVVGGIKGCGV